MKLTPENSDYADSRPPTGIEVDIDQVPEHMREQTRKAREARKARRAATLGPTAQMLLVSQKTLKEE